MRASGEQAVVEGKSPISFGLYNWIAVEFIRKSNTFAHLYLVITWNLMFRSNDTASIRLNHLNWIQDCFGVFSLRLNVIRMGIILKILSMSMLIPFLQKSVLCFQSENIFFATKRLGINYFLEEVKTQGSVAFSEMF